ncbi:MAG: DUF4249 domain-containing protein [Bacteroidales bacterium]|nr:DUF4249 domain-containing protein [Bacteroidales bacterium]
MFRNIYIPILALLLTSCIEKDVGFFIDGTEEPRIIVNALWATNDTVQFVHIGKTGLTTTQPVSDSKVTLSINGETVPQLENTDEKIYTSSYRGYACQFKPGDIVDLQVEAEGHTVHSSIEVPQTAIIEKVDTVHINKLNDHSSSSASPYVRFMIQVHLPERMKGMQYFRLEHERDIKVLTGSSHIWDDEQERYIDEFWFRTETYYDYEYDSDPALTENKTQMSDDNDDYTLEVFDEVPNKYGLFRSNFFKDGRYTLIIDVPEYDWGCYSSYSGENGPKCNNVYRFRIITIPKIEYYYLWAATALHEVFEPGVLLSNPPIVPSNINGGTGLFTIGATTEVTIGDE